MLLEIVLIGIFILINGFFAASEIAVVTVRRTRLRQLVEEGAANAEVLEKLRAKPDRFLATIQIGVTLAGALASAIGGAAAVKIIAPFIQSLDIPYISASSEPIAIGVVVVGVTYFSLVFGELIPKSLGLSYPETVGLLVAPVIYGFSRIASLFVGILTGSTNLMLRPFGKKAYTKRSFISEEEVKILIEEGGEQGVFEDAEKRLIHSVFEFTDTSVKEVMIPALQMVTIRLNMTLEEIKTVLAEEQFSRYPVVGRDSNDIRGFLFTKDFYSMLTRTGTADVRKLLKRPYFIPETMKISNLLREMQKRRLHMAIVIDEYGGVSGLVTLEDLLEEIVGEIRDEYDTESPVIKLDNGSYIVDASISIRDLRDDYAIELEESTEYETVGGFIVTHLQRIAKTGDEVSLPDKQLRVIEMLGQRISKVKIESAEAHQLSEIDSIQ